MQLDELISSLPEKIVLRSPSDGESAPEILDLEFDSRRVRPGALFFAVAGSRENGHRFLDQALSQGAAAAASESPRPQGFPRPWLQVTDVRRAMALAADRYYGEFSKRMPLVGVTGTNGKTTTAYLVHSILRRRSPALMLGTIGTLIGDVPSPTRLTTPEAIDIQRTLKSAWEKGCRAGVMEVSSHALRQQRVYGCRFPAAVFTNLSLDHLDFHADLEDYFQSKSLLFDPECNPGIRWAIVNGDDPWASRIGSQGPRSRITFGLREGHDVFPLEWESSLEGIRANLSFRGRRLDLETRLAGDHNLFNAMAAAAACSALGIADSEIQAGIAQLQRVPGRFERVDAAHPAAFFVDYAHTPAALENVLRLCRSLVQGRLISIFGCGGDRDRGKRPEMGRISARLADLSIVTSDNPRSEPPAGIVGEILAGVPKDAQSGVESIVERRRAIRRAVEIAQEGDIVLVAGKGHECYQEIQGERLPFDDGDVIREECES